MDESKIIEGNKLIAKFMGGKTMYCGHIEGIAFPVISSEDLRGSKKYGLYNLLYHKSWTWLMPVVQKCFNENMDKAVYHFDLYSFGYANIMEIYDGCVSFIKWYNLNKPEDGSR